MASLYVYMNGYEVGEYSQPKNGPQTFIYSDSWLERRGAVPISLSLPLTEKSHRGDVVYNFFDNLLPDSLEIRNRIQSRFGIKTNQAFDLLSTIGRDCAGAIQLLPEQAEVNVKTIEGTALNEEQIANELRQYKTLPLGMSKDQDFRISLAGAQEKTAFLWHNDNWMRPIGTTPSTHIFKLPIGKIEHTGIDLSDSVENEWLCLEILKTFGLPVAEARIETFEDMKVLVVKRFDREIAQDKSWIIRHPVEDICQALGVAPALKYESDGGPGIVSSMKLLASSIHAQEDRFRFMQSVFLFWMLGAIDGHAKNFSLFLKQGGRFELTPLYDVISAYPLAEKRDIETKRMKMAMALHGKNTLYKWQEIQVRHWFDECKKVNFPPEQMEVIIHNAVEKCDSVIEAVSSKIPKDFPESMSEAIFSNMRACVEKVSRNNL